MAEIKWSQFPDGGAIATGDETVGLRAGANVRFTANEFTSLTATGLITPDSTAGILGTTTNDNADTGSIGEHFSAVRLSTDALILTSTLPGNVAQFTLGAGDWDLWGHVVYLTGGATKIITSLAWMSTTSLTVPSDPSEYNSTNNGSGGVTPIAGSHGLDAPYIRLSLAVSTQVFLGGGGTFSNGSMAACGSMSARRAR